MIETLRTWLLALIAGGRPYALNVTYIGNVETKAKRVNDRYLEDTTPGWR